MFENIIGHNDIKNTFTNLIINKNLSRANIFSGINGIGKKKVAVEIVKAFNCRNKESGIFPCQLCTECLAIENKTFIDFLFVEKNPDSKDISIDDIRNIKDFSATAPILSNYKFIIINGAEYLNNYSSNALLKILEEGSDSIYIFLVTNNLMQILSTIRSRCLIYRFNALNKKDLEKYFEKIYQEEPGLFEDILSFTGNNIYEISCLEKDRNLLNECKNLLKAIEDKDIEELCSFFSTNQKEQYFIIYKYLRNYYDKVVDNGAINKINLLFYFCNAIDKINQNINPKILFDNLLINWE